MKKSILILLLVILNLNVYSQNCDCATNFIWLKNTFENNDAGYDYIIKKKGQRAYDYLNNDILNRAKLTNSFGECRELMAEWLKFFRKYHLSISLSDSLSKLETAKYIREIQNGAANISKSTLDTHEKYFITDSAWNAYLSKLNSESIEGVWSSPPYTIGIIKQDNAYVGFVIDAPGTPFRKGDLKLKIYKSNLGYSATNYGRDFKPSFNLRAGYMNFGPNSLFAGNLSLKRVKPYYPEEPDVDVYLKTSTTIPSLTKLSSKTNYFKIPSFDISNKKLIDSIISKHKHLLSSTENLIIDLRSNGGGSDYAYEKLFPYIYTNPIRTMNVEYKSTSLNNQYLLTIAQNPIFEANIRQEYKTAYDTLQKHLGEFVLLNHKQVIIDTLKEKIKNPLRIAILTDENTGSSAEQFVIDMRQSIKVKVYGKPTLGSLDISNMTTAKSPSGDFILKYGITKSLRVPDYIVDDIGVMPDVYLDNNIPAFKWVSFVQKLLEH